MKCEKCGQEFTCSASDPTKKCWCTYLPPLEPVPQTFANCLCPRCLQSFVKKDSPLADGMVEGTDFYYEGGLMVFTEIYHLKKGVCCGNGCRHCPY